MNSRYREIAKIFAIFARSSATELSRMRLSGKLLPRYLKRILCGAKAGKRLIKAGINVKWKT